MNQADAIDPGCDGIRLLNGTRETNRKHASRGRWCAPKKREQVLAMYLAGGIDALDTPTLNQLQHVKTLPHLKTCQRWIHL